MAKLITVIIFIILVGLGGFFVKDLQVLESLWLEGTKTVEDTTDSVFSYLEELEVIERGEVHGLSETTDANIPSENAQLVHTFGVLSDSHGYVDHMEKALREMNVVGVEYVFHLGDFTAGGEQDQFQMAYDVLSTAGIPFAVLPGDHDYNWVPSHSRDNFEHVFGPSYEQFIELEHATVILFDNSTTSIDDEGKRTWLSEHLEVAKKNKPIIFMSSHPLFSEYFPHKSDTYGEDIGAWLSDSGVEYTVAGNTHVFARYSDPNDEMRVITVGAIGEYKNPLPQWVLLEVYDDGTVVSKAQPLVDF